MVDELDGMPDIDATLDAWRALGADRVQPARFRLIDALARRAPSYGGDARRLLDERLAALIADYAKEIERAKASPAAEKKDSGPTRSSATVLNRAATQSAQHRSPLGELVDLLANRRTAAPAPGASIAPDAPALPHLAEREGSPELPMLDYFRETWSRFSTEKHFRQSLAQVPDNAGPLNSHSLVHRSLALMRERSPGYLRQFLSYVDALSCMEHLAGPVASPGATAAPAATTQRASGAKKGARGKAR
jgi:hypothetical protein